MSELAAGEVGLTWLDGFEGLEIEWTVEALNKRQMAQRRPVVRMMSAGGVVYRPGASGFDVVLCGRRGPSLWALPKGTPELGETREQTALREVSEETGLEVRSEGFLDSIEYWFTRPSDGARCHKVVHFYLMSATGGDVSRHDHEFDDVRWLPAPEALRTMTYASEARVVEKGVSMASRKRGLHERREGSAHG